MKIVNRNTSRARKTCRAMRTIFFYRMNTWFINYITPICINYDFFPFNNRSNFIIYAPVIYFNLIIFFNRGKVLRESLRATCLYKPNSPEKSYTKYFFLRKKKINPRCPPNPGLIFFFLEEK